MPLADLEDINLFLPTDKIKVDDALYASFQLDAERIVRGYLAGHITSATLATWATPGATPGLIRAIVGRLVAAFYYRERYSEDSLEDPAYPQTLYNIAMELLNGIVAGTIVMEEVSEVVSGNLEATDYYPNNKAPGPYFTLDSPL